MEKLSTEKTRNSNIELLRVLSMLMIVAYHYSIFGFYAEDIMYSTNKSFVDIFGMGGKIGTDVFVLISGYYMVKSRFTLKKLLELMGRLWFYTLGILIVYTLIEGPGVLNGSLIKLSLFPLLTSHYWFVSYYVLLMILSPFLNVLVHSIEKRALGLLCLFLYSLVTLLPQFAGISFADGSLWLFVALYLSAAYVRLYIPKTKEISTKSFVIALVLLMLCALKVLVCNIKAQRAGDVQSLINSTEFMNAYSPFAFAISVLLLIAFVCCEARYKKLVSALGNASFGVYLFHANLIVNQHLYQTIFHTSGYAEHPLLFVHAIVTVFVIYVVGTALDLLRQKTVAPLWNVFVDKSECFAAKFCGVRENNKTGAM